jgi:hypothetical protein
MSNYLAVAMITATLQRTLQGVVQKDIEGARVTTVRPSDIGNGTPETGVNLFLYQVITNPALNNIDATPSRSRGNPTKRQAALDLYYMFSFYGNEVELEPQRLLGSVVRSLNDKRVISQEMIRESCRDATLAFLQESDLADQVQQISLVPLNLNLEDLSKAWSVFFQTPYLLSIGYKVLVVMLEGDESPTRSLPIRDRRTHGLSPYFSQPQIEQVMARGGVAEPILSDSMLVLIGKQLKGDWLTQVRLCDREVAPTEVSDTQIVLSLAEIPTAALRAGVQSLQVIHPPQSSDREAWRRGKESNTFPFVLRPRLLSVMLLETSGEEEELRSGQLQLQLNLLIGVKQRVVMVLNEWRTDRPASYIPASYLFDAPSRSEESNTVTIAFQDVRVGEYLIRVMVDGAESQLQVDDQPGSPTYDWYIAPKVMIR